MKIKIYSEDKDKYYTFHLPLALLSFILKKQFINVDNDESFDKEVIKKLLTAIKKYRHEYGSFVLLETFEDNKQSLKIII